MTVIVPVILAGGHGTRLWPLSRRSFPKQFSSFVDDKSLFQKAAQRATSSNLLEFDKHMIITNSSFRFIAGEQLQSIGLDPGSILIEPSSKNTAPAILAASISALDINPEATLLVMPSDHIIPDKRNFHNMLLSGINSVQEGNVLTFGVQPTHPETGYGYLELSNFTMDKAVKVNSFVEKPEKKLAEKMLKSGNFLWNSGIFLFQAKDMLTAFQKYSPSLLKSVKLAVQLGSSDLGFWRLAPEPWNECKSISIDHAIMEKLNNLYVVPFSGKWSDLGDWQAIWKEKGPDKNGVVASRNALALNCKDSMILANNSSQTIVGLGLDNIIAVAMPDAVLVTKKNSVQDIKKVVAALKIKGVVQAEIFPIDYRPWGWFEILLNCKNFLVKRILVNPGAGLSLQSHEHRSENWVVVEGTAKVTLDGETKLISEGESIYIPLGSLHRMENPGKTPMILIEVQTGNYIGEDDITRYDDFYARS